MIYSVKRTSVWDDEQKPCDEAFKAKHETWHTRSCTEQEFNQKHSKAEGLWRSKGKNHTTTNEGRWITRQEEDIELWSIHISSLGELMKFVNKYGDIVLKQSGLSTLSPEIEIYDHYRE